MKINKISRKVITGTAIISLIAVANHARGGTYYAGGDILMENTGYIYQYPDFPIGSTYGDAYSNFPGYIVNLGQLIGVNTLGRPIANFTDLLPFVGRSLKVVGTNGYAVVDIGPAGITLWDKTAQALVPLAVSNGIFQVGGRPIGAGSDLAAVSNALTILNSRTNNWNLAYSWGNHAANGYVTGTVVRVETDPKVGANSSNYLSKWNGTALVAGSIYNAINGNIGIGTNNPANNKLTIVSEGLNGSTANGGILVKGTNGTIGAGINLDATEMGGDRYTFFASGPGASMGAKGFGVYNSSQGKYVIAIISNQNVGFGVTAPTEKLEVAGKVKANGIRLTPTTAPASPAIGDMYVNSATTNLMIYLGTWKSIATP